MVIPPTLRKSGNFATMSGFLDFAFPGDLSHRLVFGHQKRMGGLGEGQFSMISAELEPCPAKPAASQYSWRRESACGFAHVVYGGRFGRESRNSGWGESFITTSPHTFIWPVPFRGIWSLPFQQRKGAGVDVGAAIATQNRRIQGRRAPTGN